MTNVRLFAEMIYGMVVHSQVPKRETIDLISEQIAKYLPDAEPVRYSYKSPKPRTCETCDQVFDWIKKNTGWSICDPDTGDVDRNGETYRQLFDIVNRKPRSPQSADVETVRKKIELAIKFGLPIDARIALKEALAALDRIDELEALNEDWIEVNNDQCAQIDMLTEQVERLREALSRSQCVMELGRVWAGTKWKYPVIGMATVYDENEKALAALDRIAGKEEPRHD